MIAAGSRCTVSDGSPDGGAHGWSSMPKRRPSGAVQAVPVLFDTGDQTGDDALGNPSPLDDRCGPGRLTLVAGIEPLELIAAKNDDGVEASNLGGDMVLPTLTGVGLTFSPGVGLFGGRAPGPPVRAVLSLASGGGHARFGSGHIGDGLAGPGADIGASPGQEVGPGLLGFVHGCPGLSQLGTELGSPQVTDAFCPGPRSGQGQGDGPGVVRCGQRDDGLLHVYCR